MASTTRRSGKPSVVFILVDDMGIGNLSSVNGGLSHTPTLDGLMAEGTRMIGAAGAKK